MNHQQASRTALATAYLRAAHQLIDGKPLLLDDPLALQILGRDTAQLIEASKDQYQTRATRGLRAHVLLRSRFAEDQLAKAVAERGVRQYILIGAGLDTFAWRQPPGMNLAKVVEVDHPDSQQAKIKRVADSNMAHPANLVFAGINFEQETLLQGLVRHGISTDVPTFFSWLGVTMYLTEPAIDATLDALASFPAGSEVVMTFLQPSHTLEGKAKEMAENLALQVAAAGEPFISFFTPEQIEAKLRGKGFATVQFMTPEDSVARYFGEVSSLPPPSRTSVVSAVRG